MKTGLDSLFAPHSQALQLQAQRLELITANLANADTPGFKARDIDFRSVLRAAGGGPEGLAVSHAGHMSGAGAAEGTSGYRVATQATMDGNTVDTHVEKSQLAEASIRYESTLVVLGRRINGLRSALRLQS